MIQVPTILAILGGIFGIAGALATAAAIFRTTLFRSTIADQDAAIKGLEKRAEVAENSLTVANARIALLEREVDDLQRTKEILANEVTGSTKLGEIATALVDLQRVSQERHAQVLELLAGRA